ncbi:hypothetical protein Pmar_PMAR023815 [Perkinsus marinus ATCC 50983]|uniref:HAT C-terminal dimerisation domain-containing protein n=1 Tax=Perkinsus marinus (strain ATCC 50983 / TXsc) TaxID=423536 RepID=C5KYK6_PERM5|nr:hypothetical protein Pmar_PMAR023815 [Perkinsus marinus ATCC 50983]EER10441.1 hypothetical protein Pmar_PMAR023815 [Perkinsus marinus ATCC 50983]|eukprot:XP_002778646.1 hypothetical protein Pmar_PMAR023815 [Perkinsus marinus ATCC 50983]
MQQQAVAKMFAGQEQLLPYGVQDNVENELGENCKPDDSALDESESSVHRSRVVERVPNQTPRAVWLKNFSWLSDVATTEDGKYQLGCKICMWAKSNNRFLASHRVKDATLASGTFNGPAKKVAGRLSIHESTSLHQHAQRQWNRFETEVAPVSQLISSVAQKQSKEHPSALLKVLLCLQFLLRQGVAIRGHIDRDANFWRLLDFVAEDCTVLSNWVARTSKRSGILLSEWPHSLELLMPMARPRNGCDRSAQLVGCSEILYRCGIEALEQRFENDDFNRIMRLELLLTIPPTSCEPERSFRAMGRLKSALRSTMGQPRLEAVMRCHIYRDLMYDLDLMKVANRFIDANSVEKSHLHSFEIKE